MVSKNKQKEELRELKKLKQTYLCFLNRILWIKKNKKFNESESKNISKLIFVLRNLDKFDHHKYSLLFNKLNRYILMSNRDLETSDIFLNGDIFKI
jgi:hypothetical protein